MHTSSASEPTAAPHSSPRRDALHLLLDSHEQIRRHTALAVLLGHAQAVERTARAVTASRLIHFFSLGLALHLEEEDSTLVPHLFAAGLPEEAHPHLWEMGRQHEELEQRVDELLPLWALVRDSPERYPEVAGRLAEGGRRLADLMEEHLGLEERHVFPLARSLLSPETLAALAVEMRERRGRLT